MKRWQLAGIISGNSRSKLILPPAKHIRSAGKDRTIRASAISKFFQQTLRNMTDVITLF